MNDDKERMNFVGQLSVNRFYPGAGKMVVLIWRIRNIFGNFAC